MSVLILVQIEEFDMLEKFHSLHIIDQIEKRFGYKLLNIFTRNHISLKMYII